MLTKTIQRILRIFNLLLITIIGGVLFGPQAANALWLTAHKEKAQPTANEREADARGVAATGDGTISGPTIRATLSAETARPAPTDPADLDPTVTTGSINLSEALLSRATLKDSPRPTADSPKPVSPTYTAKPTSEPTHEPTSEPTHSPTATPTSTPSKTSTPIPTRTATSTPTPKPTSSSLLTSARVKAVLAFARAQLGERYVFGGMGNGWDCSGLTKAAFAAAGINIGTHSATDQYRTAKAKGYLVPYSQRKAGDLIFYTEGGGDMYHVTIYSGNGNMIEAADYGIPVREVAVRSGQRYGYVARFIRG